MRPLDQQFSGFDTFEVELFDLHEVGFLAALHLRGFCQWHIYIIAVYCRVELFHEACRVGPGLSSVNRKSGDHETVDPVRWLGSGDVEDADLEPGSGTDVPDASHVRGRRAMFDL